MLNKRKYADLVPPELAIALPAGGVFGAVYTGTKHALSPEQDQAPTASQVGQEVAANSIASGAATGAGLLLNKYIT